MPGRGSIAACLMLLAASCASLPETYPKPASMAEAPSAETTLGAIVAEASGRHHDRSGFGLMTAGRRAFTSRIALTDLAERTIDAQYYIWDSDATGRILAERLVRAADRGVRVRILIDDLATAGRDPVIATLDAHPNIEVRVFNAFANRRMRSLDFLSDMDRVNHRMHNKMMIFDNAAAVVGGRNVADIYFEVATDANYRDLDIAAVGPIVPTASHVFDHFWNGKWSVPISALVDEDYTQADLDRLVTQAREKIREGDFPYPLDAEAIAAAEGLPSIMDRLVWAPGAIVWDDPAHMEQGQVPGKVMKNLIAKVDTLEHELLIESAYFVIPDSGEERLGRLVDRGVRVRVLTNSLESNDVIAAHAGHAAHRKDLIVNGVEMYELKTDAETVGKDLFPMRSRAALHTKALVFDRSSIFVGSFNLDPRSAAINTEAGIYVESPKLAADLAEFMDDGVLPDNSYHLMLDEDGELVWVAETDGRLVELREEPGTNFSRRFMVWLINALPVEHLL